MKAKILAIAKENPYGFTFSLETEKMIKKGIAVAYFETQNSHTEIEIEKCINHALENDKNIGGWLNTENNKYYFDSIKVFKNVEKKEAISFAKQNKQIAIFDLTNLEEIKIK
jgi:fructokinase